MKNKRELKKRLLERALEVEALKFGNFLLSSGKQSDFYFDGRLLSLDPEGLALISNLFFKEIIKKRVHFVGGPTMGADPIVAAITAFSYKTDHLVNGFLVRGSQKTYGTGKQIEGHFPTNDRVILVDDTCTTGKNLLSSIKIMEEKGARVAKVLVVLDRGEGGSLEIKKEGFDFSSLLTVKNNRVVLAD